MTPAQIEAHKAEVRAHVALVDAARARKEQDPAVIEARKAARARREADPVVVQTESDQPVVSVPARIAVAGVTKYQAGIARALVDTFGIEALRTTESDEFNVLVTLEVEPSNPHDRLAVKVTCAGHLLGYVPREHLAWAHEAIGSPRGKRIDVTAIVMTFSDRGDGETLGVVIPEQHSN